MSECVGGEEAVKILEALATLIVGGIAAVLYGVAVAVVLGLLGAV